MGDFVTTGTTKAAARELAVPIADMSSFQSIIQNILDTNPWGCTPYLSAGISQPGVSRTKESYSGKVVYQDAEVKVIGTVTIRAPASAAFGTCINAVLADTALGTAMGGTAAHDASGDKFSSTLRCHSPDGELYYVTFSREKVRISSFESDNVRTGLESWADTIPALA